MADKLQKKSFMDKFIDLVTKIAEPLAKLAEIPFLASIQDGMLASMPLILIGSFFLILGAAADGGLGFPAIAFLTPHAGKFYTAYNIGMGFMGLYIAVASGIAYGERLGQKAKVVAPLVIAAFLALTFNDVSAMGVGSFGAGSMFVALLVSLLSVKVYAWFIKKNIVIRMPDSVPDNVGAAFTSLIPYAVIISACWLIRTVLNIDLIALFTNVLQPLVGGVDNIFVYGLDRVLSGAFWSIGLHYDNMTYSITGTLMTQWIQENAAVANAALEAGQSVRDIVLPHIWVSGIHNWANKAGYGWPLIVMLLTSKAPGFRQMGAAVTVPMIFSIGEPLWFGLPVILNPYLMFGMFTAWVMVGLATYVCFMLNLCTRAFIMVPWASPDFLGFFIATGGDWRCFLVLAIDVIVGAICWYPFFKAYERSVIAEHKNTEELAVEA